MLSNYNIKTNLKEGYDFWLVNKQGDIFIKTLPQESKNISTCDMTLTTQNFSVFKNQLCKQLKLKPQDDIEQVYDISSYPDQMRTKGYIAHVFLSKKEEKKFAEALGGRFINYRDIEEHTRNIDKDMLLTEAYSELLRILDGYYGWFQDIRFKYNYS